LYHLQNIQISPDFIPRGQAVNSWKEPLTSAWCSSWRM